jgi:poly(hydroxyalkanoate) depolymerase family esterase
MELQGSQPPTGAIMTPGRARNPRPEVRPGPSDRTRLAPARPAPARLAPVLVALALLQGWAGARAGGLEPLKVQDNPGLIDAYVYVPKRLAERPALVVALHGCTQRAADFDDETGWTALAEEAGFVLLLPEQSPYNNPTRCFNWFNPTDYRRNLGEPESIRHQVEALLARYPVDRNRIFVTGLSAGGGMTSVMLATHPDLFAGGAVLGGVPYGCAANAFQALPCMQYGNRLVRGPQGWAAKVRAAAPQGTARWPMVAIWHDSGDRVVSPYNALSSMEQWTEVHGIDRHPEVDERIGPHRRLAYADAAGKIQVELWTTERVGHATPIDAETGCGFDPHTATDFVADADLCATRRIARFWGLVN